MTYEELIRLYPQLDQLYWAAAYEGHKESVVAAFKLGVLCGRDEKRGADAARMDIQTVALLTVA
jgi:hypothetical protein